MRFSAEPTLSQMQSLHPGDLLVCSRTQHEHINLEIDLKGQYITNWIQTQLLYININIQESFKSIDNGFSSKGWERPFKRCPLLIGQSK